MGSKCHGTFGWLAGPARGWSRGPYFGQASTPTPVIDDAFRDLRTDIPTLLVHGNFGLSTPIENAEGFLSLSENAHLIRI